MSRIAAKFDELKIQGRTALIPFITAGDPQPDATVDLMHGLVAAGADIIELGVPFSDPMADGPVIQRASERALAHGVSLHDVLDMVRKFRERDPHTGVVLMGYLNPVEVMGYEPFAAACAQAGVDGALLVDMPPEEADEWLKAARGHKVDTVFLLAPTSTADRIQAVAKAASGFVYYVSLKGVTGAKNLDVDEVAARLAAIRALTSLPIGVGFGISDAAAATRVSRIADAVIVGSALVRLIEQLASEGWNPSRLDATVYQLLRDMRSGMDFAGG
ncbi:MAG: tryptophan synthase subunit alpha [Chromatiales bacterium]|nr:tryptophan synthase subunit alpha [Chromatiales bacterium]